ncbi:hypothetical protein CPT_Madawaska_247 [Staphylococcus phage Madawaska]|nr:hypothetical protein CPT_Madawaska_247 [Staphylococcus phage Madawaska]
MHIKKFNEPQLHFVSKMIDIGYNNKIILLLFKKEFNVETISAYITQVRRGQQGKDISQNYKFAIEGGYPTYFEWIDYLIENDVYYNTKFELFGELIKKKIKDDDESFIITKSKSFDILAFLQETEEGFKVIKSIDDLNFDEKFVHRIKSISETMNGVNLNYKNSYLITIDIENKDKYKDIVNVLFHAVKGMDSVINYNLEIYYLGYDL